MTTAPSSLPATGAASTSSTSNTPATTRRKQPVASSSGADSDTAPVPMSSTPAPRRPVSSDPLSEQATSALIRRVLCPQQQHGDKTRDAQTPIEELLPPLTSRNDVDLELYAFLAIILRDFVQSWYGRLTTDESFIAEIVHIIAHCTRTLEQRARKVDMESLLFDEVPDLLQKHITDYRVAHQSLQTKPIEVDPRQVYHSLCPLPPLSPVPRPDDDEESVSTQKKNEAAYRQLLTQAVLAVLLPTEDLENPCLTALVGQILSELIIGNVVVNKAAQPWLLYEGICTVAKVLERKKAVCGGQLGSNGRPARRYTVHTFFLSIIDLVLVFIASVRLLASAVMAPSSLPPRFSAVGWNLPDQQGKNHDHEQPSSAPSSRVPSTRVPILEYSVWSCAASLTQLPARMPWLGGFLSLLQHAAMNGPGHFGRLDGTLDRFLSHRIQSLLHHSHLPPLLRTLRGVLFPNNSPGKQTIFPPSSDAELLALRRRAASALLGLIPEPVGRLYLGGRLPLPWGVGGGSFNSGGGVVGGSSASSDGSSSGIPDEGRERLVDEVEQLLLVVSDEYCNKHLLYGVLELILVRLMPELAEMGVEELWEERLG